MQLCLCDLVEITGGVLRLADMPPRDGALTKIGRISLSATAITAGDVFWRLDPQPGAIELAYLRGAIGIVAAGPEIQPWPGRFAVSLDDPLAALAAFAQAMAARSTLPLAASEDVFSLFGEESCSPEPELKGLQLCAARGVDIYPPTTRKCRMLKVQ